MAEAPCRSVRRLAVAPKTADARGRRHGEIGDILRATVDADAWLKNAVIVPRGTVVSGRLRRPEVHDESWPCCGTELGIGGPITARLAFTDRPANLFSGDGAFTFNVAGTIAREFRAAMDSPSVTVIHVPITGEILDFG